MATMKLTSALIREMTPPATGQKVIFDSALPGFGLRLTPGAKTFVVQSRVAGRTRRVTIGTADVYTADQARKEAKKLLGQMASGKDINAERAEARVRGKTLKDAYGDFLNSKSLKPNTVETYRQCMTHFNDWMNLELRSISPLMMVQRHRKIADKSGPAAANGAARVFRAIWNYTRALTAAADGSKTMPESPTQRLTDLRQWAKLQRRTRHLTEDLFPIFRNALETMRAEGRSDFADFMELLLRTGLRRSEAAGLLWEDVSLANRTLTVHDTKNHDSRTLPLSMQLEALLRRRHKAAAGDKVFMACGDPRKSLARLCKLLNADISAHDLRRTFATIADGCDLSGYKIKRLLGHALDNNDVTAGYIITDISRLRSAMQRISDRMDEAMLDRKNISPVEMNSIE